MPAAIPVNCSTEELFSRALEILDQLVAFDTTSRNSNLELISYVRKLLSANAIASSLHFSDDRSKAALVATAGTSESGNLGVIWSGHTDVVPVDGQVWASDPFRLRVADGLAIGRGTADMKGFIACCLAILTAIDHERIAVPVTLLLTDDEEVGCLGARRLLPQLRTWSDRSVGCIVGEPTDLAIVIGHKGKQNHRICITGLAQHAALAPETENPIATAAAFIRYTEALNGHFRTHGPHDRRFANSHSWINIGRIQGGSKPNIVPSDCLVELEIRAVPGHNCDEIATKLHEFATGELQQQMRARLASAAVIAEQHSNTPCFSIDESHPFVQAAIHALQPDAPLQHVPFGTEAGLLWEHARIPTIVWGPGSIAEAHTADEAVPLSQLMQCLNQLQSLPVVQAELG